MSENKMPWKVGQRRRVNIVDVEVGWYEGIVSPGNAGYPWMLRCEAGNHNWGVREDWPNELVSEAPEEKPDPRVGDVWLFQSGGITKSYSLLMHLDNGTWECSVGNDIALWTDSCFTNGTLTFVRRATEAHKDKPWPMVGDVWRSIAGSEYVVIARRDDMVSWNAQDLATMIILPWSDSSFTNGNLTLVHRASEAPKEQGKVTITARSHQTGTLNAPKSAGEVEGKVPIAAPVPVCIDCGTKERLAKRWLGQGPRLSARLFDMCDGCYLKCEHEAQENTDEASMSKIAVVDPIEPCAYRPLWRDLGGYGVFNRRGR